jgi:hypothetical protein
MLVGPQRRFGPFLEGGRNENLFKLREFDRPGRIRLHLPHISSYAHRNVFSFSYSVLHIEHTNILETILSTLTNTCRCQGYYSDVQLLQSSFGGH